MRLRKKGWISEAIQQYQAIMPEVQEAGRWQEIFGRPGSLQVELGCGKGQFISGMAAAHPEVNFVGIEAQLDVVYYAAKKVTERQLPYVRLLCTDAAGLSNLFALGEIDRLYINFCDPWPKDRHAKRRLTHRRFLEEYRKVLRPGGQLFFKTDNEKLFEFSLNQFAEAGLRLGNITFDLHSSGYQGNIMTEYEAKFSSQGNRIYRCEAVFAAVM